MNLKHVAWLSCLAGNSACSPYEEPARLAQLSSTNRPSNAIPIAQAVRQLCVDSAPDPNRFQLALRKTGWPAKQTQRARPGGTLELDVWRLPFATLVRSPQPIAGHVWTCSISIEATAAPPKAELAAALKAIADGNAPVSDEIGWQWKPSISRLVHMTMGASSLSSEGEVMIFVEVTELPPLRAILGS